ncbi:MAG: insulinase family protein [Frankiales bacterium]|nr:insulinase family protein [Frankiales bacterium]
MSEVDGVPVLTGSAPGPLRGGLLFRVGQADEALPIRGITHLVEHLALTNTSRGPHAFNGATEDVFTAFVVAGEPQDVCDHLASVCEALSDLPLDRLEHERGILRAEAARRGPATFASSLSTWRWGATGFGLLGFDEIGLPALDEDKVNDWSKRWFTRENAALWLSGPLPRQLQLPLAPSHGSRGALPGLDPILRLPAAFSLSDRGIAFSYLADRAAEGPALMHVIAHRLRERLRNQLGVSYNIEAGFQRLAPMTSMHMFFADTLPENASAAQAGVVAVLESIRSDPPTRDEIDEYKAVASAAQEHPDASLAHIDYVARQLLFDAETKTVAQLRREQERISPRSVHRFALDALRTLLLAAPDAKDVPAALAGPAPQWSTSRAKGKVYGRRPGRAPSPITDLIVGDTAISAVVGENCVTVPYAESAALVRFDDDARTIIGLDGFRIAFAPEDWHGADGVARVLDLRVPETKWVPGGSRGMRPPTAPPPLPPTGPPGWRRLLRWRNRAVVVVLAAAVAGLAPLVSGQPTPGDSSAPPITGDFGSLTPTAGECLLTDSGLDAGVTISSSCAGEHQAEILTVGTAADNGHMAQARCNESAHRVLTPTELSTLRVKAANIAGYELICYAEPRNGAPLTAPLPRKP